MLLLFYNRGYRSANRYLAGFLFFCSLYLLENFFFFYGGTISLIAFFTTTHAFFYLIGPLAFLYQRSILNDDSKIYKADYLHFVLFAISFSGYIPYFFSAWQHKLTIAENIYGSNWDMSQFHINYFIPHKIDQALNLLQTIFYAILLWYMIGKHKKKGISNILFNPQYILIRKWLFFFTLIYSVIAINFGVAMANMWIYDDKNIFLQRANGALLFASCIYVCMNLALLFFPHILYGLPSDMDFIKKMQRHVVPVNELPIQEIITDSTEPIEEITEIPSGKRTPQLFRQKYITEIENVMLEIKVAHQYLSPDFQLNMITQHYGIPAHHLTYYFNEILMLSFSNWRNKQRINYAISLIEKGITQTVTIEAMAQQCGFISQTTFIRSFKTFTGLTPSEFVKQN